MSDMTYIDPLPFAVLSYNCLTCNTKKAKYVCPKCSVPYCSSRCYKAHNLECTEDFYMENVIQNLKSKRVTREEAKKFNKILQNVNEIEITNQILTEEDEKRLEKMLETDAEDIRLTQDEHAKFLKDVKAGVLMKYIEEWVPWWIDVEPVNLDICDIESPICKAYLDLPSISALTSKPPSDQLINHITNLIWSYIYIMRSFNGDIEYSHIDMLDGLFELSQVLTQNTSTHIPSLITSINLAVEKALVFDYDIAKRINLSILYDLHLIFCHKFHIVRTLFKLNEFLGSENISEFMKDIKINRKIEFARKKVFFYMCYIKSIPQNDLKNIADEILKVYQDRKTMKTL